jgi:hypothetical protein
VTQINRHCKGGCVAALGSYCQILCSDIPGSGGVLQHAIYKDAPLK